MEQHAGGRDRILVLARALWEESDSLHPVSMERILAHLQAQGLGADRKTVYRDLAALRQAGLQLHYTRREPEGWYLKGRTFTLREVMSLWQAVLTYRGLSDEEREKLLRKIRGLAPKPQRGRFRFPGDRR